MKIASTLLVFTISVIVFADAKLFSGPLKEWKVGPISFKHPDGWKAETSSSNVGIIGARIRTYIQFSFVMDNSAGKSLDRAITVLTTVDYSRGGVVPTFLSDSHYIYSREFGSNKAQYYRDKKDERANWHVLVDLCAYAYAIKVDYSMSLEEAALLEKKNEKVPAELEEFISHISCTPRPPKEKR